MTRRARISQEEADALIALREAIKSKLSLNPQTVSKISTAVAESRQAKMPREKGAAWWRAFNATLGELAIDEQDGGGQEGRISMRMIALIVRRVEGW